MTRAELRASMREAKLMTWGALGATRFRSALMQMAKAGEIALEGDDVIALSLRQRRPKAKPPEKQGAKMRRMAEKRRARAKAPQLSSSALR